MTRHAPLSPSAIPTTAAPSPRYALAYAPHPGTLGWLAGSHWLGRCAALLQPLPQLDIHGVAPADLARLTAAPRRQGWQAPFTAPFTLAPGVDWLTLHHTVHTLAQGLQPLDLPPLQVQRIGDFLALVPMAGHAANTPLAAAAAACVAQLHTLAAPTVASPTRTDRFHMPLTGSLTGTPADTVTLVLDAAEQFFADLPPLRLSSLALFTAPAAGADFVLLDHVELGP